MRKILQDTVVFASTFRFLIYVALPMVSLKKHSSVAETRDRALSFS